MNRNLRIRPNILRMSGYVPGEQPKFADIVKLNTNENPYPPSPEVKKALAGFDYSRLDRYPDPVGQALRETIAKEHGVSPDQIILANGSDDTLTMVSRVFADETHGIAFPVPTYSLYKTLCELQNAPAFEVPSNADFEFPDDFEEKTAGASIAIIARPNSPTGNIYPRERMERLCRDFKGAVMIDEAYADFASDSCMELVKKYDNLIVSRTFSKSRALAGLRFGYAVSSPFIIEQMMKAKDSYNVSMLTQTLALAAFRDKAYLAETTSKIKEGRARLVKELRAMGFRTIPSETNFVFAAPPAGNGAEYFAFLRERAIVVRYFKAESTRSYVRITVGLPEEIGRLLDATRVFLKK